MLTKLTTTLLAVPLFCLFLAVSTTAAYAKGQPLYVPEPVPLNKHSTSQARKKVRDALQRRGWIIKDAAANVLRATYTKPGRGGITHKAVVDVVIDKKAVRIKYRSSEELQYDKAANTIHSTYNRWVRNMEKDFHAVLGGDV